MDGMDGMDGDGSSGMMSMRQVTEIPVPADGSVALEPGGYHVMLLDLKQDLTAGQTVPVTLTFSSGATTTVDAEVRAG
jgi:copper(I)-binding protein